MAENTLLREVCDRISNIKYKRIGLLAKGGFGKCYKVKQVQNNKSFACKVISKEKIQNNYQFESYEEINVHKSLNNVNIIKFHHSFEDPFNFYIVMDFCPNKTLKELQIRRKYVTNDECRYFMKQIFKGVCYLHDKKILHRDLKLDNIFLNEKLQIRIGDFGLVLKMDESTYSLLLSTASILAPELFKERRYSYAVDVWAMGCIMYRLLIGKYPFTPADALSDYNFVEVTHLDKFANNLLISIFQRDPSARPTAKSLLSSKFIKRGPILPKSLPINNLIESPVTNLYQINEFSNNNEFITDEGKPKNNGKQIFFENYSKFWKIIKSIKECKSETPLLFAGANNEEDNDPDCNPLIWILQWIIDDAKLIIAYQFTNKCIIFQLSDKSKFILMPNGLNVQYMDSNGTIFHMTTEEYPKNFQSKIESLLKVQIMMMDNLKNIEMPSDECGCSADEPLDKYSNISNINFWYMYPEFLVCNYTNELIQFIFNGNVSVLMCPRMNAITYIDGSNNLYTYSVSTILDGYGCAKELFDKLELISDNLNPENIFRYPKNLCLTNYSSLQEAANTLSELEMVISNCLDDI